ncbi:hypothetical protein F5148DRAFT_181268 [Russula earlei]|uniref:Uncharacterized protein n=1 Tax=Russula earlei TaxID=71964 RepID=A0ACC0UJI8_9AGAM|nr:hypothetical protein F5148DRAFT_181268 [Russula earlei]
MGWQKLVHVCRRWRAVVFASRHRLDLRLLCTYRTPVRKILDCWPPLPIIIRYGERVEHAGLQLPSPDDEDNIIVALENRDRVCEVELAVGPALFARLMRVMQKPFPLLESLVLRVRNTSLALPNAFLGGFAPRLCDVYLDAITPPALPMFLSSAMDLVHLQLVQLPRNPYTSSEALVAALSAMTRLKILRINFADLSSPPPYPTTVPSSLVRRVVLPALFYLEFQGTSEYLEDFAARIDGTPSLGRAYVSFFDQQTMFEIPHFAQLVARADMQRALSEAQMLPSRDRIYISLCGPRDGRRGERAAAPGGPPGPPPSMEEWFRLQVSCAQSSRQVPLMARILRQISSLLSCVRKLEILTSILTPQTRGDVVGATEWLGLFLPFGGVEVLHVAHGSVPDVARALRDVAGERAAEVLPALRELRFDWFASRWEEAVASFISARQLSGHLPIAFSRLNKTLPLP